MQLDDKISFTTGWLFTTASTFTAMGLFKAAAIGFIGGFFGLLGKAVFNFAKAKFCKPKHDDLG